LLSVGAGGADDDEQNDRLWWFAWSGRLFTWCACGWAKHVDKKENM